MPLPPAHEIDGLAAGSLQEAIRTLKRAFAEGLGDAKDFPKTAEALKELQRTFDTEKAVEAAIAIGERLAGQDAATGSGKRVCCMVDGSMNSFAALRWSLEHVVDPEDDVYLVTVIPYDDFRADADKNLQEAYDFAHNAGIKPARLHPRTLTASSGSGSTRGVGESLQKFVEGERVDVVVLGSRGMGSIKRSIMGSLGMGSVSDFCVQRLSCPILVIKQQQEQEEGVAGA